MFPVPANKSNTLIDLKLYQLFNLLNRPSLAISVVGLTGRFFGAVIRLLLYFPETILILGLGELINVDEVVTLKTCQTHIQNTLKMLYV